MKKLHILGLVLIAFAIAGIAISASNYTSYEGFTKANANDGKVFKIVGNLDMDGEMNYAPEVDPNLFTFYMIDKEGISQQVIYADAKPQDFERSEQLVVTGKKWTKKVRQRKKKEIYSIQKYIKYFIIEDVYTTS